MKHIVITAGGTSEAIDGVRRIGNTSTGSLAACIYEALSEHLAAHKSGAFTVHYVVSETAARPEIKENLPVTFYPVTDVKSVEAVLEQLLTGYKADYVIHAMAVSDFTKGYLAGREALAEELSETLEEALSRDRGGMSGEKLRALVRGVLERPACRLDGPSKVRSAEDLMLSLVRTPKLIEKIKQWSPGSFLVGFKLLKGVDEEALVRVAAGLSEKSGCDLVLANDMDRIGADRHEGLLLKGRRVVGSYGTKKEIAAGIAGHMLGGSDAGGETGGGQ
ncbi:phosphopantothenate-cysteine ligase [Sporobacter termitidis DSM 10068]|uniref:Phosphopantothenate-cysteine ligase n=1 Tax=Sporobacter termitidis DSM 10068 TaxID=1123282 RepID=A0A1M5XT50_9FIRM|nr:phosphopantothenoylcysteine decarboxylase [Sporobacter termitidis]SHI02688.1 phosphopantothenate-cysteine ligase [Sporobacter termitidis DSM 10068]